MAEPEIIDEEAAMAAFHADYKRRNFRIVLAAAIFCLLAGVVILIVAFVAGQTIDSSVSYIRGREYGNMFKVMLAGAAFVVVGILGLGAAYRIKRSD